MPAPKGYASKRKSKRNVDSFGTYSTPTTPKQPPRSLNNKINQQDSDSDTAAGFDANWHN